MPYAVSIVYNLAINPVMVYTGLYLGGGQSLSTQYVWAGLAIASGVAVLGMVVMGCAMNDTRRHTFYKPLSFRTLVNKLWEERNVTSLSLIHI